MWRTLRNVFSKRAGTTTLRERLGQVQLGDTNDGENSPNSDQQQPRHGKVAFAEYDLSRFEDGLDLMRAVILHAKRHQEKQSIAKLTSYVGEENEEEKKNCGTFLDELKLWCSGVLALSSILSCKTLLYDEDHNFDLKKIPQVLYFLTVQNNPRTALAVLPIAESDQQQSLDSSNINGQDSLSQAASSFATASSECAAACSNKLAVKYASKKQYEKAFALFYQAGEQGSPLAQFNLGLCYENGKGTEQNLEKAVDCYKNACAMNHNGAFYNLALFYMEGTGGVKRDYNKAIDLLERAAQADITKAQSYLGVYYAQKSPKDYSKAVSYLEKAAIKNDNNAEYHLGICYEHGLGVERDLVLAGKMYKEAARHGNISAQYNTGVFYEHGLGDFPVDNQQALRYFRMAAEAGDQDAQHNYTLLSKQVDVNNSFKHDLLWTIFQKMTVGSPNFQADKGMARCMSTPNITDSNVESNVDNGNPLVAF